MNEEREYEQQEFLKSVIAALHRKTEDDEDYVRKFTMIVALCTVELVKIDDPVFGNGGFPAVRNMFEEHILTPLRFFAKDDIERRFLLGKLAEKLVSDSIMPSLVAPLNRQELERYAGHDM